MTREELIRCEIEKDFLTSISDPDNTQMLLDLDIHYFEQNAILTAKYNYLLKRLTFLKNIRNQRETNRKMKKKENGLDSDQD